MLQILLRNLVREVILNLIVKKPLSVKIVRILDETAFDSNSSTDYLVASK